MTTNASRIFQLDGFPERDPEYLRLLEVTSSLIAPTIGVIQPHTHVMTPAEEIFFEDLLRNILDQTTVVASKLGLVPRPGRIIYIGDNNNEPLWVTHARKLGWGITSIGAAPDQQDANLTYTIKIEPKIIVACNAEILVQTERSARDLVLIRNLIPEALMVNHGPSGSRYWCIDNAEPRDLSQADFHKAVQNLVNGSQILGTNSGMELVDNAPSGFSFGGVFPFMVRLLSGKRHRTTFWFKPISEILPQSANFGDLSFLRPSTSKVLSEAHRRISPFFVQADESATYYGDRYRSLILLGLFFTFIAFLALIFSHANTRWSLLLRFVEFFALLAVLVTAGAERWFRMHRKWLVHRMIAELLRPSQYLLPLWLRTSRGFDFPDRPKHLASAIAYQRVVIRNASPLDSHLDQTYLDEMRHVILDLLSIQIDWHSRNANTHQKCQKWFVRLNTFLFLFLIVIGALSVLWANQSSPWAERVFDMASICTLCISISGACIHYFSFDHVAERSETALRRYQTIHDDIRTFGTKVDYSHIIRWVQEAADTMAEEQLDWFRQTSRLHVLF